MADSHDRPSPTELAELREMMELVGESEDRIGKVLQASVLSRDRYERMVRWYEKPVQKIEGEGARYDWDYPFPRYDGGFRLGTDLAGNPVGLTREQVNEHILVVGRTGAGKTTLFYNLMDECVRADVPFLVFDFKNDYRHLARHRDVLVVNWRDLKVNPLQPPPGVQPGKWGEVVADTFAHATDLLIGSESYFLAKLRDLYGLYDTDSGEWPSVFELRALVAADEIPMASPRYRYKERVWSRLAMMTGDSSGIFDCSTGYPLERLLERNVVVELKEPNQYVTRFVVEALLAWIFYYRDAQGQRSGLRHVILFDEAKQVFDVNRERQAESGFPPIDELVGAVREFGEALIVADHEPSKLTDSIKANTNAKLWLSLGSGKDTHEMRRTFGLDHEKTDYTRTLEKGEAVLWLAGRDPVPVHLPDYQLDKTVTEEEIRTMMDSEFDALPSKARVQPDAFQQAIGIRPDRDEDAEPEAVGDVAEALLASVIEEPFLSLSERYDVIEVGKKIGSRAKNELLTLELVQEVEVRTGTRGRNPKLLELTQQGRAVLEDRGYEVAETGRRGIEHRYWQHQIKEYYEERGFTVELEFAVEQSRIDVYATQQGEAVAVEVARSPEHEVENVQKCLDYDVDRVEVAYLEDDVRSRIESAVEDAFGAVPNRVVFVPAANYV